MANLNYSGSRYSKDFAPNNIMLLSFNYTKTEQQYVDSTSKVQVNHIHGCLDDANSVIFGYGDELDSDFEKLKNLNAILANKDTGHSGLRMSTAFGSYDSAVGDAGDIRDGLRQADAKMYEMKKLMKAGR